MIDWVANKQKKMISQDIELFEYTFIEKDILDLNGVLAMCPASLLSTNKTNKHACKSSKFRNLQVNQQNTEKVWIREY